MLGKLTLGRSTGLGRRFSLFPQTRLWSNTIRPKYKPLQISKGIRRKTTEAGEDKSGHIHAGPNEGILFLDSKDSADINRCAYQY